MIKVRLDHRTIRLVGLSRATARKLDEVCSYSVEGAYFSQAFKGGHWDGKEHLLKQERGTGHWVAPRGLTIDIVRELKKLDLAYKVEFVSELKPRQRQLHWGAVVMRDYQDEAVEAMMSPPIPASGILKMPIRSGKTKTAARIIWRIGRPTIFIVPSKMLLHQTKASLEECFPRETIGIIGDGHDEQEFITVSTVQTLQHIRSKNPRGWKELCSAFDVAIFDEAHHIRGSGDWHKIFHELDCRFKIGLSATAFLESKTEQGRGVIWLRATCGPVRADIEMGRLIEAGYLMRQHVEMYHVALPLGMADWAWGQEVLRKAIVNNEWRNAKIAELAAQHAAAGSKIVITAGRHDHIAAISDALDALGVTYAVMVGATSTSRRNEMVEDFVSGFVPIILGTVLREGVDIPAIDVVINAEAGKDDKYTIQRQRNLTPSPGKTKSLLIDFFDAQHKILAKHSRKRLKAYKSEKTFVVEMIK